MNTEKHNQSKKLLFCIGDIDDSFIEEDETANIASVIKTRKRQVRNGALAVASIGAASVGIVVTCLVMRSRRSTASY